MVRRTASGVITEPDSCSASNSRRVRSANATSSALPRSVTRLPRTWMSAARFSSSSRSNESREPSRPIICRSSATTSVDSPTVRSRSAGGQLGGAGHLGAERRWRVKWLTGVEASTVGRSPRGRSDRAAADGESGTWCTAYFRWLSAGRLPDGRVPIDSTVGQTAAADTSSFLPDRGGRVAGTKPWPHGISCRPAGAGGHGRPSAPPRRRCWRASR